MPFIPQSERDRLNKGEPPSTPGQRCFLEYQWMVNAWNTEPRWTTADRIYKEVTQERYEDPDFQRARELAWQVFFSLIVMPYEQKQLWKSGAI